MTSQRGLDYLRAVAIIAGCTGLCSILDGHLELTNLVMMYLIGVLLVALRGQRGPAALASALGVLCFDFFFVPPRLAFSVSDTQYLWTFAVMFTVAILISHLVTRLRRETEAARASQQQSEVMHAFSERLSRGKGLQDLLHLITDHIRTVTHGQATIFMPDVRQRLVPFQSDDSETVGPKESSVAQWVYDHGEPAGMGTSTLQDSDAMYLPLIGAKGPAGVMRFRADDATHYFPILKTMAEQIGLALEVERLRDSATRAEVEAQTERLRSALLRSVSHDLRTPIAAVVGSADSLLEEQSLTASQRERVENIQRESERLARVVHNLLEATRLESGALTLHKERYPVEDVIGSVLDRLAPLLRDRSVELAVSDSLPPVPMDAILIDQVLTNLIENAVRHTSANTEITISAERDGAALAIAVADRGPGLKTDEFERVFQKFYHAPQSPGVGLGLAICRAIMTAHGGTIEALPRAGGGVVFRLRLPMEDSVGAR